MKKPLMASTLKATEANPQGRGVLAWPKDGLRIAFGMIWLVDPVLKWLPGFRSDHMDAIVSPAQGPPARMKWWFAFDGPTAAAGRIELVSSDSDRAHRLVVSRTRRPVVVANDDRRSRVQWLGPVLLERLVSGWHAFLLGRLAQRVKMSRGRVPVWFWATLIAHRTEHDLRMAYASPSGGPSVAPRPLYLAAEVPCLAAARPAGPGGAPGTLPDESARCVPSLASTVWHSASSPGRRRPRQPLPRSRAEETSGPRAVAHSRSGRERPRDDDANTPCGADQPVGGLPCLA